MTEIQRHPDGDNRLSVNGSRVDGEVQTEGNDPAKRKNFFVTRWKPIIGISQHCYNSCRPTSPTPVKNRDAIKEIFERGDQDFSDERAAIFTFRRDCLSPCGKNTRNRLNSGRWVIRKIVLVWS
ncbi:hypothetical protein Fcan01_08736 [Folsomia candida]|uniref:Uncharacterized protein n=1 Tax=Folsomia candida TaxID=158441 RepID=A0A226EHM4_FOLCA|nr:hypothetical protein Fcan01_08736 [Folsomia candida]